MKKNDNEDLFTRQFIHLLLESQKENNPSDLPRGKSGLVSVSDILSSKKFLSYQRRKLNGKAK